MIGHEAAGEVVGLGEGVTRFAIGDPVAMVFKPFCGQCLPCLSGRGCCVSRVALRMRPPACWGLSETATSWAGASPSHGGCRLLRIGHHFSAFSRQNWPGLPWEIAALFGCAVLTGAGAVFNTAMVRPGQSVAVVGLGGVGCSSLLAARAAGASIRIAVDRVPEKLEMAKTLGATHVVNAGDQMRWSRFGPLLGGGAIGGVDVAFEMAGAVPALDFAYKAAKKGGMMVSAGLPNPAAQWSIQAVTLIADEKTVKGSYMGSAVPIRDIPRYIELYRAGQLPVDLLLGRTMALEDLHQALDALDQGQALRQVVLF